MVQKLNERKSRHTLLLRALALVLGIGLVGGSLLTVWAAGARAGAAAPAGRARPGLPAANGKIAFTSNRTGGNQIWVMNPDGSNPTELTFSGANDTDAAWSPDGTRIAFDSNRSGHLEIWVMNGDGSNPTELTAAGHSNIAPTWSPDGSQLAFYSDRNGITYQIYVMNSDGSNQHNIGNSIAQDFSPEWAPDGTRFAFQRQTITSQIFLMNADGSNQHNISNSAGFDFEPSWSPDNSKLVFYSNRDINNEIYSMNADGSGQTRLTNNPASDRSPTYSPDGTKIAFNSNRSGTDDIWVMNADSSGQTALTGNAGNNVSPSWQWVPAATMTPTRTRTATATPTRVPASATPVLPSPTAAPTQTPGGATATPLPTATDTATPTETAPPTGTPPATSTAPPTGTSLPTSTSLPSNTPAPPTVTPGGPTLTPTATNTPCDAHFSDVHPSDYFYGPVRFLYCIGAISGYADGTFRPYSPTTRSQLVKMVVLGNGFPLIRPATPTFNDVPPSQPFYAYIETAVQGHLISGYNDGTFRPYSYVTRGQTCKVVALAENWTLVNPPTPTFSDVGPNNPFYRYIETAYRHNVITGYADGTFHWSDTATRGQTSKVVVLALTSPPQQPAVNTRPVAPAGGAGSNTTIASSVPFTTCGTLAFVQEANSPFAGGNQPDALVAGDFNNDNAPDLVAANFNGNSINVLLNNGNNGFTVLPAVQVGGGPSGLATGEFNLRTDSNLDLAIVNGVSNNVTVLLGNGQGGFTPAPGSPFPAGNGPRAVAAADVNGDGHLDLLIADLLGNNVTVLLGDGAGGFTPDPNGPFPTGANPFAIIAVDLNVDRHVDIVTANYGANNLTVLLGNGAGGFTPAPGSPVPVGAGPSALAVGNFNGDGFLDLAVANQSDNTLSILLGNGQGGFAPASGSPVGVGNHPQSLRVGDFNGDQVTDLAVANSGDDAIEVLLGNGQGGFSPGNFTNVGHRPVALASGDFNRDGRLDLATANSGSNDVTVLLNICGQPTPVPAPTHTPAPARSPSPSPTYPPGTCSTRNFTRAAGAPFPVDNGPAAVGVGDFNGDGNLDLVTSDFGANDISVLLGNGQGGFSPAPGSPVNAGTAPQGLVVADFNRDGRLDLATANFASNNLTVLLGNGAGGFSPAPGAPIAVPTGPWALAEGDFNADGFPDLAVTSLIAGSVTVLLGNGQGGFTPAPGSPIALGTNPAAVAVGDFNHDGKRDLAIGNFNTNNVTILLGNGAGGFVQGPGSPVAAGSNPASIAVGDVNGDGNPDLAVADAGSGDVTILLGNGLGGFSASPGVPPVPVGSGPQSVVLADFNADGNRDLAVANATSDNVSVFLGNGHGAFSPAAGQPYPAGSRPDAVAVGDFNRDGTPDLAVANSVSADVTVLLNICLPPTPTPCPITFSDVHPSDYFYTPVLYLACHGVLSGYGDGTFRPYAQTTRSQQVKIVILGFQKPIATPAGGAYTFTDVPPSFPFFPYIETAAGLNIVSGYACGGPGEPCDPQHRAYFRPYANVTRGQLSKIVTVAAGWQIVNPPAPGSFADVAPGSAFYIFVETAVCHGVTSGYTCGGTGEPCDPGHRPYFRQYANATRGQIAKIVYLAITAGNACSLDDGR